MKIFKFYRSAPAPNASKTVRKVFDGEGCVTTTHHKGAAERENARFVTRSRFQTCVLLGVSQDNTNIDAAIACLVKSIMSLEEEDATAEAKREPESSFLVLPRFDYGAKERGPGRCSGCSSLKPRH